MCKDLVEVEVEEVVVEWVGLVLDQVENVFVRIQNVATLCRIKLEFHVTL